MKFFRKISLISLIISVGFIRDFIFVHVNYQINHLYYHNYDYQLPSLLSFFNRFDYSTLYYSKYLLTILFILIYFLLARWVVMEFIGEKKYLQWVRFSYLIVIFIAAIALIVITSFSNFSTAYNTTRKIIELVESPLIIMALLPLIYIHKKQTYAKGQ